MFFVRAAKLEKQFNVLVISRASDVLEGIEGILTELNAGGEIND